MDQPHIGYTTWRDPPTNTLAAIKLVTLAVPEAASLGVAIDGSGPSLPVFRLPQSAAQLASTSSTKAASRSTSLHPQGLRGSH